MSSIKYLRHTFSFLSLEKQFGLFELPSAAVVVVSDGGGGASIKNFEALTLSSYSCLS